MSIKGSEGGKATAIIFRKKAIENYNLNPNYCLCCNSKIEVGDKKVNQIKRKKFCSKRCSAIYNNHRRKRDKISKGEIKKYIEIDFTKEELFKIRKNWQSARSTIQKRARKIYKKSNRELKCIICGYNNHVEIAHIKSVSSFNGNSLLSEINNINNLIALCPNHHWEFDKGTLKIINI